MTLCFLFLLILNFHFVIKLLLKTKRGEIFKVVDVNASINPVLYSLEDLLGDKVSQFYYKEQLTKVKKPDYLKDYFLVDKILDQKMENQKKYFKVRYLYYGPKFDQWIPEENLKSGT